MEDVHEPSDRSFGFLIAAALLILGIRHRWALAPGVALALVAAVFPRTLHGPTRAWLVFGDVLSSVVNPLVLGVLFFGVITPVGFLLRIAGRDPLRLKASPRLPTYWIERSTPSSEMTEEF
jgi:hypothetical protein